MNTGFSCKYSWLTLLLLLGLTNALPAKAHWHWFTRQQDRATTTGGTGGGTSSPKDDSAQSKPSAGQVVTEPASGAAPPVVVSPNSIDLSTAKFGTLDILLKDAIFREASAKSLHLSASNLDMNTGTLEGLTVEAQGGEFYDFTVDALTMGTKAILNFDTSELLNNKVLQFRPPATAQVKVSVSQSSLNSFINSKVVLHRLSGSARKRVPLLSSLARQDVSFGFDFINGELELKSDDQLHLSMESRVGLAKVKVKVPVSVDTKLILENGWVTLKQTKVETNGQLVPKDMSEHIVDRVNSLSKWESASDDIHFVFTSLKVVPNDRLELEGTAVVNRVRLSRNNETNADNVSH
jgi:hypothetical protein